jgi:hypothetical protein
MLLFTADYPDYINMPCFPCKAALLNLASPWLGPCLSAKGPIDRAVLMPRSISTASVCLFARQPGRTLLTSFVLGPFLLSTKVFDTALHMPKFLLSLFSYWSPQKTIRLCLGVHYLILGCLIPIVATNKIAIEYAQKKMRNQTNDSNAGHEQQIAIRIRKTAKCQK